MTSAAEISRTLGKRPDMVVHESEPYNAEPPPAALAWRGLTGLDAFYVRNHGPIPALDPEHDHVRIEGLVNRTMTLSPRELRDHFPSQRLVATLQCAGNRRVGLQEVKAIPGEAPWGPGATGTAEWTGAPLADVLAAVGLAPEARYVEFVGRDVSPEAQPPQPFGASIPRRKALAGEVLLAWEMNGEPLPPAHGAPVRVVVPGYIGARSVKWLERITARAAPSENFFQAQTYRLLPADQDASESLRGAGVALGAVAVNADFLEPPDRANVRAGPVTVTGYAFAGDDRHIVRVDVSADAGRSWQQASSSIRPAGGSGGAGAPASTWPRARSSSSPGPGTVPPPPSPRIPRSCGTPRGTPTTRGRAFVSASATERAASAALTRGRRRRRARPGRQPGTRRR